MPRKFGIAFFFSYTSLSFKYVLLYYFVYKGPFDTSK